MCWHNLTLKHNAVKKTKAPKGAFEDYGTVNGRPTN